MRPGYCSASSSRICGVQSVEPSSTATISDSSPSGKGASSARRIDAARYSSSLYAATMIESRRVFANYGLSRSAPGEIATGRFTAAPGLRFNAQTAARYSSSTNTNAPYMAGSRMSLFTSQ